MAKGVARTNPDGTKSVIRKSYKGYIARIFQMPGAYDAVKKEREDPTTLLAQMTLPDDEWDVKYRTAASQIKNGLPPLALKQLPTALTMAKGNLPKEVWDPKVLGDTGKAAAPDQARLIQQSGGRTPQHVPSVPGAPRPSKGEPVRPKRNIKKRTYQDGSFEGYGEGFTDDYENGYSTGGDAEDRAGGRKRLKKVCNLLTSGVAPWLTNTSLVPPKVNSSHVKAAIALEASITDCHKWLPDDIRYSIHCIV